jgi:hypothetical protein
VRPTVLAGHSDGEVEIFRRKGHSWVALSLNINSNELVSLCENVHRNLYMLADSGALVLVDRDTLAVKSSLPCEADKYLACCFSPDSQGVLTLTRKGMLSLRSISKFELVDYMHLGFQPGRRARLATGKDCDWVAVWDGSPRLALYSLTDRSLSKFQFGGRVLHLEVSRENTLLLQLEDNSIVEWSPSHPAATVLRDESGLATFSYTAEMGALATGSALGLIKMYSLDMLRKDAEEADPPAPI